MGRNHNVESDAHSVVLDYSSSHKSEEQNSEYRYDGGTLRRECPVCEGALAYPFSDSTHSGTCGDCYDQQIGVASCACGWWSLRERSASTGVPLGFAQFTQVTHDAVLRRFDVASQQLPIAVLRTELLKRPSIVHDIQARKMEELVGSVLADFGGGSVVHCGRTGDGGIDLMLVENQRPLLIQVKRRQSSQATEGVAPVRELLGASLLSAYDRVGCVFVSTAHHFSLAARQTALRAVERGLVTRYDLIARDAFLDILKLTTPSEQPRWRPLLHERWPRAR